VPGAARPGAYGRGATPTQRGALHGNRERYDVTVGLPTVVGRGGAAGELEPEMSDDERRGFDRSAATLREAARRIGVRSH
jgi:malate/lactate dehydrogenase